MNEETKKQLIYTLVHYGARAAKLSSKQRRKLSEWILAYTFDEMGGSYGAKGFMPIQKMRVLIDRWENPDLNEENYKYYYVDKNSDGKSLWDII